GVATGRGGGRGERSWRGPCRRDGHGRRPVAAPARPSGAAAEAATPTGADRNPRISTPAAGHQPWGRASRSIDAPTARRAGGPARPPPRGGGPARPRPPPAGPGPPGPRPPAGGAGASPLGGGPGAARAETA